MTIDYDYLLDPTVFLVNYAYRNRYIRKVI